MSKEIKQALKLADSVEYHREQLALAEAELAALEPTLEEIIAEVADRFLVNEQGQPVNGGVYWYEHQAIVRIDGEVLLIRMETKDSKTLFARPEPPAAAEEIPLPDVPANGKVHDQEVQL